MTKRQDPTFPIGEVLTLALKTFSSWANTKDNSRNGASFQKGSSCSPRRPRAFLICFSEIIYLFTIYLYIFR
jgi:hypothetical protein